MATLRKLLFEDPFWLYVFLGVVELALLELWRRRRTGQAARRLLVPLVAAGLVFTVATLVVTRRERLVSTLEAMAQQARQVNVNGVAPYLADDFHFVSERLRFDKGQSLQAARVAIAKNGVQSVVFKSHTMEIAGDRATVRAVTQILGSAEFMDARNPLVVWTFYWRYGPDGWKLTQADQPELAMVLPPIH
jgi:hypothetical protein